MLRMRTLPLLAVTCACLLSACQKEPGEGGKAEIKGKVYAIEWDENTGQKVDSFYVAEARVYIVYGDHEAYDDDTRTGPDGLYKFSWLRKGEYTVFTYSECPTCPNGTEAVLETVEIGDRKESVEVPTLRVNIWH